MALMDMSIILTALYTISVDFKNYRQTLWAALSYILADIGCAVFFTRLADVFGRRQILLTSFFFFTCFSLACGFSQTVEQLILFRTLFYSEPYKVLVELVCIRSQWSSVLKFPTEIPTSCCRSSRLHYRRRRGHGSGWGNYWHHYLEMDILAQVSGIPSFHEPY
jgi:hypothetical protein